MARSARPDRQHGKGESTQVLRTSKVLVLAGSENNMAFLVASLTMCLSSSRCHRATPRKPKGQPIHCTSKVGTVHIQSIDISFF
jgi:hypothetical protein